MTFCHKCGMQLPEGGSVKFCPNCGALLEPQIVQDTVIIAEFHYWDYGEFSKTAMKPRPEIKTEELEKISREFNVKVEVKKTTASYFTPNRIGIRIPSYNRIEIQVSGEQPDAIKSCIGRIFMLYGQPDRVPTALSGGKKAGKKIIDELLREFNERKR
jgi:hypothetical protein